ncbi:MAG: hypothetical protein JWO33_1529, partial [Caulobacteraceae bacterium]|nr:hypothetical protein [Caulobacteraceae bacterium]
VTQAEHMIRLAGDENLRQAMGTQARVIAEGYDSVRMAKLLEDVLVNALERPPA